MLNLTKGLIGAAIVSLSAGLCLSAQAAEINSAEQKASNVQPLVLAAVQHQKVRRAEHRKNKAGRVQKANQQKQGGGNSDQ